MDDIFNLAGGGGTVAIVPGVELDLLFAREPVSGFFAPDSAPSPETLAAGIAVSGFIDAVSGFIDDDVSGFDDDVSGFIDGVSDFIDDDSGFDDDVSGFIDGVSGVFG